VLVFVHLAMAWYCQRKLEEISAKTHDSLSELKVYCEHKHIIDRDYFDCLESNTETTNVPEQMEILENTANTVAEMKALTALEEKQCTTQCQLTQREKGMSSKKGGIEKRKKTAQHGLYPYEKHRLPSIHDLSLGNTGNEPGQPSVPDQLVHILRKETEQPISGT